MGQVDEFVFVRIKLEVPETHPNGHELGDPGRHRQNQERREKSFT